jgi:hypothetical protein
MCSIIHQSYFDLYFCYDPEIQLFYGFDFIILLNLRQI